MHRWKPGDIIRSLLIGAALVTCGATTAYATSSSTNYQATDLQFGGSSAEESCSGQYCSRATIGDMTAGASSGPGTSTAKFSSVKDEEPRLEVIVDRGISNLGVLSTTEPATKTTVVRVLSYLSDGYTMQIMGESPSYSGHALATPSTPTVSTPGTEQFGINVVDNTTPNIGADPVQVPSSQTSFGEAMDGYDASNQFKYASGDTVARSRVSSGRTDYTISMIINVSNKTPAGHYSGDFSVVITPYY